MSLMNNFNANELPFDSELQIGIVNKCLVDPMFLYSCQKYIKHSYFENDYLGWLFKFASNFYEQFHYPPSVETIRTELLKFAPEQRVPYEVMLHKVSDTKFRDIGYLKQELTKWTKKKFLFDNMHNFIQMYSANEDEKAYNFMHEFATELLEISYDKSELFDFGMIDEILENAKNSYKYRLKLGIPPFDEALLGGIARQRVCLFIGPMHGGKSIILLNIARNFVEQGYKPLFIDLENDLNQVILRIFSSFTQIPYHQFFRAKGLSDVELDKIRQTRNILDSSLFLRSITDFTVFVENIITECKQLYLKHQFDAIILDYSQILKIKHFSKVAKHEYLEEIMRGLSCLARELDIAVVTAAQINRAAQAKAQRSQGRDDTVDLIDIAESFGITRVADPIITITKSSDDDLKNRIRLKLVKNRDGEVGQVASCEKDFACCRIFAKDLVCRLIENQEQDDQQSGVDQLARELNNP